MATLDLRIECFWKFVLRDETQEAAQRMAGHIELIDEE